MQKAFEDIVERLEERMDRPYRRISIQTVIEIVNQVAEEYKHVTTCYLQSPCEYQNEDIRVDENDGWIPCSERLPKVETEVLIYARRKYTGGHFKDIITTAMYEDGTVRENDSCWRWEEIEGEWDEEEDCYIIPEGWWENKHYNPDGELNYAVDDKILAWRELPQPYQPKGE